MGTVVFPACSLSRPGGHALGQRCVQLRGVLLHLGPPPAWFLCGVLDEVQNWDGFTPFPEHSTICTVRPAKETTTGLLLNYGSRLAGVGKASEYVMWGNSLKCRKLMSRTVNWCLFLQD